MKLISLSKFSKVDAGKYFAQVDDEDFEYLNQWNWYVRKCKRGLYVARSETLIKGGVKRKLDIHMHRVILKITDDELTGEHRDRNGLNNQKSNLRVSTKSQNMMNRRAFGKSKYSGVSEFIHGGYRARIHCDKKSYFIGYFKTEVEAALAYNARARELHGEFANLNVIQ